MPNIKIDVFPASYSRPSPLCKKIKYAKSMGNEETLVPEMHQLTSGTGNATADTKSRISKSMEDEEILVIGQVSTQSSNRSSSHHRPSKIFSILSLWRLVRLVFCWLSTYSQLSNKRVGWNFFFKFDKRVGKIWCCLPVKCPQVRASRVDFFFLKRIGEHACLLES